MKKLIVFFAALVFGCGGFCGAAYGFDGLPAVFVDYEELDFPVEAEIIDGEVYVPIRTVLEKYLNREIYFVDTASGKLLIADTNDGRFMLNLNNGAYAYIISNYSYGVVSLYDNTGENKMGILEHKPFNKEGYTMLPVKEVLEILDGEVSYDEAFGQISVVSDGYKKNIQFAGEPFPIVWVFGDMDIYESVKLADCTGYEDFVARCLDFFGDTPDLSAYTEPEEKGAEGEEAEEEWYYFDDDNINSEYFENMEEYNEITIELFGYLYDLSDNDLMQGDIKEFLTGDFSQTVIIDEELGEEETIENMSRYVLDKLSGAEGEGVLRVGSEYEEAGRLSVMVSDFMLELAQIDFYGISEELYKELEERDMYFDLMFSYGVAVYGEDFWESLNDCMENMSEEYGYELFSRMYGAVYDYYNFFTRRANIIY